MQEVEVDTSIVMNVEEKVLPRVFFHQYVYQQIRKNPTLVTFAKQTLIASHPRTISRVEFNDDGEWSITYSEGEVPVRYKVVLTNKLTISDVSWSTKYNCYFDYFKSTPFVVDADIVILLYLASLEGDMTSELIGEWMRSATHGRYTGFNIVHLVR